MLSLKNIGKRFGSLTALDDVAFRVDAGEVVGLVGDNGAGKSTCVKIISGMFQPGSGHIEFDGKPRVWASPHEALAAGIETVYQDVGLASHLSVDANIFLGREMKRPGILGRLGFLDNAGMRAAAEVDTRRIGIRLPDLGASVGDLSGGQRQAVAIARSISWARKVLILDEPTNHLGVVEVEEVLRLIRRVRDHGVAVVLVSHTLPHVMAITDRIVVLRLGRVAAQRITRETTTAEIVHDIMGASEAEITAHTR